MKCILIALFAASLCVSEGKADTVSWPFNDAQQYVFDSTVIEVTDGDAILLPSAPAGWLSSEFTSRYQVTVCGQTNADLIDYAIQVNVPYLPGMQPAFDDLRFTASDGLTLLPHYKASCTNSLSAEFWVKAPVIPRQPDSLLLYMYFGNQLAVSTSDGSSTFEIFDDFTDGSLTPALTANTAGSASITEGAAVLTATSDTPEAGWVFGSIRSGGFLAQVNIDNSYYADGEGTVEALALHDHASVPSPTSDGSWDADRRFMILQTGPDHAEPFRFLIARRPSRGTGLRYWNGTRWSRWETFFGGEGNFTIQLFNDGNYLGARIVENGINITGDASIMISDVRSFSHAMCLVSSEPYTSKNVGRQIFENYLVRPYTDPEPEVTLGGVAEILQYSAGAPAISNRVGQDYASLQGFYEVLGSDNIGYVRYQVSSDGNSWYWFNGSSWAPAFTHFESNTAESINGHLVEYNELMGKGTFFFQAFLYSDGTEFVQLDEVILDYVPQIVSVKVSDSVFSFGVSTLDTWIDPCESYLVNEGTIDANVFARISPLSDGSNLWGINPTANGNDIARIQWSSASPVGPWMDITAYDTDFPVYIDLPVQDSLYLWIRIQTPLSTSSFDEYSCGMTVTVVGN